MSSLGGAVYDLFWDKGHLLFVYEHLLVYHNTPSMLDFQFSMCMCVYVFVCVCVCVCVCVSKQVLM